MSNLDGGPGLRSAQSRRRILSVERQLRLNRGPKSIASGCPKGSVSLDLGPGTRLAPVNNSYHSWAVVSDVELPFVVRRSDTGCIPLFLIVAAASGEAKNRRNCFAISC